MSLAVPESARRLVRDRAQNRCEYCLITQAIQAATFHIEHIIPRQRGGSDTDDNLALACPSCNLHKSDHIESQDPETGQRAPLFHPRQDDWDEHFRFDRLRIIGITPVGRATAELLDFNSERRLLIRKIERSFESEL